MVRKSYDTGSKSKYGPHREGRSERKVRAGLMSNGGPSRGGPGIGDSKR